MGDYGLELYSGAETSFVAANRKFYLEPTSVSIDDSKSLESFEIPSLIWNEVFDSSIVTARWTYSGKFYATDSAWTGQPNFNGRGFDFVHELRSLLKGIDSTTGNYDSALDQLIMVVSRSANEKYNTSSKYSSNAVYVVADRFNFTLTGGEVNSVDYSITFLEVSGVIRI